MRYNLHDGSFLTVDNGTREGLDKFLEAASSEPETVLHYEFMQDYKVSTITLYCQEGIWLLSMIYKSRFCFCNPFKWQ